MSGSAAGIAGSTASGAGAGASLGPIGAVVGAVVGAGIGIFGAVSSANSQADIDKQKADLEAQQATEVMNREFINDASARSAGYRASLDFGSEAAATGHGEAAIGSQLEIQRQTNLQIQLNDEAAIFQAKQIMAGASMEQQAGDQTRQAGTINAIGQGVNGFGKIVNPNSGVLNYQGTQSLPGIGTPYTDSHFTLPSFGSSWGST